MRAATWIEKQPDSILDIGCNAGAWLLECRRLYPNARLAGIDINGEALAFARSRLPEADLREAGAECIPFPDSSFHYATCIEVLEHVPPALWRTVFREVSRVLRPGGRLILSTPHAGWFAWLDSNNLRFRFPELYRTVVHKGLRDAVYEDKARQVEWHQHFRKDELIQLAGSGWKVVTARYGGLLLRPLADLFSWPFYRSGKADHPVRRLLERIASCDRRIDYGKASYGIVLVLERAPVAGGNGLGFPALSPSR